MTSPKSVCIGGQFEGLTNTIFVVCDFQGKKILGATCSTDGAAEYNLDIIKNGDGKYIYRCICKGLSQLFAVTGNTLKCVVHYWQCPLTT